MFQTLFQKPDALRTLGDKARDERSWKAAAHFYQKYIKKVPDDSAIMIQLGHALKEDGRFSEASDAYRRALQFRPGDADLYLQIAHLNKITGQMRAAISHYRRALEIDPKMSDAQQELDRLQSFPESDEWRAWRAAIDRKFNELSRWLSLIDRRLKVIEAGLPRAAERLVASGDGETQTDNPTASSKRSPNS